MESKLDELSINTIRCLAIDMVQKANSGHPGAPLGMSLMVYSLWDRFLKHNPNDPKWPDRDRFILARTCFINAVTNCSISPDMLFPLRRTEQYVLYQ